MHCIHTRILCVNIGLVWGRKSCILNSQKTHRTHIWLDLMMFYRFSSVHYVHYGIHRSLFCARTHNPHILALCSVWSSTQRNRHYGCESIENMNTIIIHYMAFERYRMLKSWIWSKCSWQCAISQSTAHIQCAAVVHAQMNLSTNGLRSFIRSFVCLADGWLSIWFYWQPDRYTCRTIAKMNITVMQFIYTILGSVVASFSF